MDICTLSILRIVTDIPGTTDASFGEFPIPWQIPDFLNHDLIESYFGLKPYIIFS